MSEEEEETTENIEEDKFEGMNTPELIKELREGLKTLEELYTSNKEIYKDNLHKLLAENKKLRAQIPKDVYILIGNERNDVEIFDTYEKANAWYKEHHGNAYRFVIRQFNPSG